MTASNRPLWFLSVALAGLWFSDLLPAAGATLTGTFLPIPQGTNVNLTAEGPLDWVHWGLFTVSGVNRKAGVSPQIPDFTTVGYNGPYQYADNFNGYSWSDGTPTRTVTNTPTGVWMFGKTNGFQLTIPVTTATNILKVYVGTFGAVGKFDATLGGTNNLTYSDTSITNEFNGPGGCYTLTYAGDAPDQTLTVSYVVERTFDTVGNVTLQAAALTAPGANHPPVISIASPTDGTNFAADESMTVTADGADTDGMITRVEFFAGDTLLGETAVSPFTLTWSNAPPGKYLLTAKAFDDSGATATSDPVEVFVYRPGGMLSGDFALPPFPQGQGFCANDLSAEGTSDWAHWGLASPRSFDHRDGVSPQISDFTKIGSGRTEQLQDALTSFCWTSGTPTVSATATTTGVFIHGLADGFSITAPADTSLRTLKVYVSLYGAEGRFQAQLSDFTAAAYMDTSLKAVFGNPYRVYTLNYAAASAEQTLTINYTANYLFDADYGNVALLAATLSSGGTPSNRPPAVEIISPSDGATFTAPADILLGASASDSDGTVSKIEFFQGANKLGEAKAAPYSLLWSGVSVGSYTLTVTATDNLGAVTTSNPIRISVSGIAPSAATLVNTAADGTQFSFSFAAESNRTYAVERTGVLNPIQWQAVTNVIGNGGVIRVTDSALTDTQQFYRVITR